uniref:histidine kinase n=1 Tax=Anaerolinea thermolimosa TaxID=229919 RepID=A0A7C4PNM5_9CHLR
MLKRLLNWMAIQTESVDEKTVNQFWFQSMVFLTLVILSLYVLFGKQVGNNLEIRFFLLFFAAFFIILLLMLRSRHFSQVGAWFGVVTLTGMLYATYRFGGVQSSSYIAIIIPLVIIVLFFRGRMAIIATSIAVLFGGALVWAEAHGLYTPNLIYVYSFESWVNTSFIFIFVATWVGIAARMTRRSLATNQQEIRERSKAEADLQEQTRFLSALHETTLAIINRLELGSLLESVLESALELTSTEHGYVDMYEPQARAFTKMAARGVFTQWVNIPTAQEQGLTGEVFRTKNTVLVADYTTWNKRLERYTTGFYAIIAAPLKLDGEVIGIIGLGYTEPGREFTPKQISALEQFAELAALAVDNARLYQSVQSELSERKRVQEALTESEENLRLALNAARMSTWSWNILTNETTWSDAIYDLFGIEKGTQTFNYLSYHQFVHPEDQSLLEEQARQSLENPQKPYSVEHRILQPNGEMRWIAARGRVYTDENGHPVRMAGTMIDITERKLSEAALHEANQQLEKNARMLERRSQLLRIAADVSRAASAILDSHELSQQVVDLIQQRFNLYYVGLFMVDEAGEMLCLRAATGEAGQKMLNHSHKLPIGNTSMVGWSVANRQARIALDVGADAIRFNNPLPPKSRSELALPLISRGQALGVGRVGEGPHLHPPADRRRRGDVRGLPDPAGLVDQRRSS